jgi:hypothetical protein
VEENYALLEDSDDYDPLMDASLEDEDEELELIGNPQALQTAATVDPKADTRSPREKVASLIDAMKPHKSILLGLIDFCKEPQVAEAVDERLAMLTQFQYCVYDGVELRRLLQEAEAFEYLEPATDEPATDEQVAEPQVEKDEDGQEYLVIKKRPEGLWLSTTAAVGLLEEQDAGRDFQLLMQAEPCYLDVYRQIIDYCRSPRTIKEIDQFINGHPLLKEPRRYGGYFIERLEKNGGLEWRGNWVSTDLGISFLEQENA